MMKSDGGEAGAGLCALHGHPVAVGRPQLQGRRLSAVDGYTRDDYRKSFHKLVELSARCTRPA